MVGDQQRRPVQRHVIRIHDADAVDGVRQHPQAEADQEVRQQDQQVDDDRERHQARQRRNQVGRRMDEARQHHGAGGQQDADGVHDVVGGDHQPAFIFIGFLLQHGVQRHAVDSAEESEQAEADHRGGIAAVDGGKDQRADGNADGADRHQAQFDLVSREPAGRQAADADPDGEGDAHQADRRRFGGRDAEGLDREHGHQLLHQRADEPEVAEPKHGQPQSPITIELAKTGSEGPDRVPGESALSTPPRMRAPDAEGAGRARDCDHQLDDTDDRHRVVERLVDDAAERTAEDDGKEGRHLDQRVAARDVAVRQQLRQAAVFGGAVERRLGAHEERHHQHRPQVGQPERRDGADHHDDLEALDRDQHRPFREPVGELAGIVREQQVGDDEGRADDADHGRALERRVGPAGEIEGVEGDRPGVDVDVEAAQELGGQHPGEAGIANQAPITAVLHLALEPTWRPVESPGPDLSR